MDELARLLVTAGHEVWLFLVLENSAVNQNVAAQAVDSYRAVGIRLICVDPTESTWVRNIPMRSYAAFRALTEPGVPAFDWVHFPEYHGLGFYFISACTEGLVQPRPATVVQLHGPTRWAAEANMSMMGDTDALAVDWMERCSIAWADHLVSPSEYLAEYVERLCPARTAATIEVIPNAYRAPLESVRVEIDGARLSELVFFGRHEPRKGLVDFCDAVDRLDDMLAERGGTVTFLGDFGRVNSEHSGTYLLSRAARWSTHVRVLPGLRRNEAEFYLREATRSLVVVASPVENSPYTVVESLACGRPVITSTAGGAGELIASSCRADFTFLPGGEAIAALVTDLADQTFVEELAWAPQQVTSAWLEFHERATPRVEPDPGPDPLVSIVITHYERPRQLLDAVNSILAQDYGHLEVIVVDDGSDSEATQHALALMEPHFARMGVRLVRQANAYLGAARNRGLEESSGEFVLFLDDDDVALPTMVSTLVRAARNSGADVLAPFMTFLPQRHRADVLSGAMDPDARVSFLPLGGPMSLAPVQNTFGPASSLMRAELVRKVGAYTELAGVGHEDHELYCVLAANGADIRVVPLPLYLYEVDRPSMISSTSAMRNHKRLIDRAHLEGWAPHFEDFVAMVSAQHAASVGQGRERYLAELRGASPEELALAAGTVPHEDQLQVLQAVARQRGLVGLESDLAESQREIERLRLRLAARQSPGSSPRPAGSSASQDAALALRMVCTEIALGELDEENVRRLGELIESDAAATDLGWLTIVPWAKLVGSQLPGSLQLVEDTQVALGLWLKEGALEPRDREMALSVRAWLLDHALSPDVGGALQELIDADELQYLRDHPDVASEVDSGTMAGARAHYLAHGAHEGRTGFTLTRGYLSLTVPRELLTAATLAELARAR